MRIVILTFFIFTCIYSFGQYQPTGHRVLAADEIPVNAAGSYAKAGATYVLTKDITSERSTVFLGRDVVLDLNGYTIKFADANYNSIPNAGFENGAEGWDFSEAPGARVVNTADVHVFLGDKLLSLKAGDEITSPFVFLPVENRSYFAMCGITGRYWRDMKNYPQDEMRVSVFVEDENGKDVKCYTEYGDTTLLSCPVEGKMPRLGGGFVYAHLVNLPAGKYRVRIKAVTDCLVDEIDIRPAMDTGIGIIEKTLPLAHYDHVIMESYPPIIPAFYDYTGDMKNALPLPSLPKVSGSGTVVIKNGVIEAGSEGILSFGIQSTAPGVKIFLENVKIKNAGISSAAADILYANIKNCTFQVDMPFLIQRHVGLCAVNVKGDNAAEIAHSEFLGGQGCLSVRAKNSVVHDNLFVNHQTVTNHYSIMGTGEGSKIYNNRFEPKQGSGIYVSRHTEVYNNVFKIETSPPTCEYGREEYSTAAVRLGDYHAKPGSPNASVGNRVHDNTVIITAKNYPSPEEYIPMAWGIFYSASGGENYIYRNNIRVYKPEPSSKVKTAALYICGGPQYFGGRFYENRITTNVPAAWIATMYGGASNSKLTENTIVPLDDAEFNTFEIGYEGCNDCVAKNVEFHSNEVVSGDFKIHATNQDHKYAVYWTLHLTVTDKNGNPVQQADVQILNNNKEQAFAGATDDSGQLKTELKQYSVDDSEKEISTPYTIVIGEKRKEVSLNRNQKINIIL